MKPDKNKKGFALLVAILISSFVLSVSVSIALIASKELGISNTLRESTFAYYSSESGVECAKYWATKDEKYFAFRNDFGSLADEFKKIRCNDKDIILRPDSSGSGQSDTVYDIVFSGNEGTESEVQVIRKKDSDVRNLSIFSRGYNLDVDSDSGNKVQRLKEINVVGPIAGDIKLDVMITMDVSGSMGGERSGRPLACDDPNAKDIDCAIEAISTLTDVLFRGNAHVGFNGFNEGLRCKNIQSTGSCGDERLEIPLTDNESWIINGQPVFDFFFGDKVHLDDINVNNYVGTTGSGSNYHGGIVFARAELNGKEIIPKSEGSLFGQERDLGFNSRDRSDDEYPDVYILIGDFIVNAYYDTDWSIGKVEFEDIETRENKAAIRAVNNLRALRDEDALIYLIVIGDTSSERARRLRSYFFEEMDRQFDEGEYTRFNSDWSNLEETFLDDVLGSLGGFTVIPIQDK